MVVKGHNARDLIIGGIMKTPLLSLLLMSLTLPAFAASEPFTIHKQTVSDKKAVIATTESVREVQARARISGTVSVLSVKEGDMVKKGDKIAIVGDPKLAIQGQGLEASIQAAQSSYNKAKIDLMRAQELRQSGYGTQAKLDEAKAAHDIARQNLESAKSARDVIAQQATEGAVLAPSTGRILKVPVTVGSVVMAGEPIAMLTQDNYILRLELPERFARFLNVGDPVEIGARSLETTEQDETTPPRTGTIALVYPEIKNGRVIADVTAADLGNYFVGERVRVYVNAGSRETYLVPALMITKKAGLSFVKLEDGSNIIVQTGERRGEMIEILSGLNDGDKVVAP